MSGKLQELVSLHFEGFMKHCKQEFRPFDIWYLFDNKGFYDRSLKLGKCPVCKKAIAELKEIRKESSCEKAKAGRSCENSSKSRCKTCSTCCTEGSSCEKSSEAGGKAQKEISSNLRLEKTKCYGTSCFLFLFYLKINARL